MLDRNSKLKHQQKHRCMGKNVTLPRRLWSSATATWNEMSWLVDCLYWWHFLPKLPEYTNSICYMHDFVFPRVTIWSLALCWIIRIYLLFMVILVTLTMTMTIMIHLQCSTEYDKYAQYDEYSKYDEYSEYDEYAEYAEYDEYDDPEKQDGDGEDNDHCPPTTKFLCDKELQSHHVGQWFQVTACVLTPRSCAKQLATWGWQQVGLPAFESDMQSRLHKLWCIFIIMYLSFWNRLYCGCTNW